MPRKPDADQPSLADLLPASRILLDEKAPDWEAATRTAGILLVNTGAVEERYVTAMVDIVRSLGPYVVVAPGVALPHARPEDGVHHAAFSFLRLREPVAFGHAEHDPVDLVIALAAPDKTGHTRALAALAHIIRREDTRGRLRMAKTPEDVQELVAEADAAATESPDSKTPVDGYERTVRLPNPSGLHARPATVFAERAAGYDCDVTVRKAEREANAKSVLSVLTLDFRQDDEVTIRTTGPGAQQALSDLVTLVESGLGEDLPSGQ